MTIDGSREAKARKEQGLGPSRPRELTQEALVAEDWTHLTDHIEKLRIKHENNYFVKRSKIAREQPTTNVLGLSNELMGTVSSYLNTKEKVHTAMAVTCLIGQCEGSVKDIDTRFGISNECGVSYGCDKKFCGCKKCMKRFDFCPECSTFYCKDCLSSFATSGCMFGDDCKLKGCWECALNVCAGCDTFVCKKHSMKSPCCCCGKRYCRYEELLECCDGAPMDDRYRQMIKTEFYGCSQSLGQSKRGN